ncbi:hypothetical protein IMG5_049470 [Ichthyophthirius multifiliis]|uniref:Transmembrane protein n=1 Tax=Ichthyophthirius multifiliis TaxID=5932 RepID=G0QMK5_ICHMU|nr:hypothetical protein IMG5_049470 [Ichthyophthirius multifiliis]EGR33571.1 hypothetical protein IMG5_049470 [Ichthyophthirius multifiliis]|eukprot:XP_004037557.1 hypothetical protein IMG5_049470 [Ichthyophthirius multifiliis]
MNYNAIHKNAYQKILQEMKYTEMMPDQQVLVCLKSMERKIQYMQKTYHIFQSFFQTIKIYIGIWTLFYFIFYAKTTPKDPILSVIFQKIKTVKKVIIYRAFQFSHVIKEKDMENSLFLFPMNFLLQKIKQELQKDLCQIWEEEAMKTGGFKELLDLFSQSLKISSSQLKKLQKELILETKMSFGLLNKKDLLNMLILNLFYVLMIFFQIKFITKLEIQVFWLNL